MLSKDKLCEECQKNKMAFEFNGRAICMDCYRRLYTDAGANMGFRKK